MKPAKSVLTRMSAVLLLLSFAGCIGGKSPGVTYYRLMPVDTVTEATTETSQLALSLGVGPITVADYLKKAQIATRVGGSRYEFNDFHRWAGIIEQDIANVLRANFAVMLKTDKVSLFPWRQHFKPDYRVEIDISQFDAALTTDAKLEIQWTVTDSSGKNTLLSGTNSYSKTLESSNYDELISAESALLADFTKDVSDRIRKLAN